MKHYDVAVLGGGLLGCFAARALTRYPLSVALLEAREDVCTGVSKANTAVIYAGYDTKPGTLKTQLCVEANRNFDTLCRELGVAFRRCGSLMVSYGPRGDGVLRKKYAQGRENGVDDLRLLDGREACRMEPGLVSGISSALYAPGTGTADPWELCIAAYENAVDNGCAAYMNAEVRAVVPADGGYVLETAAGEFFARTVVNCCGLQADAVQELLVPPSVRIVPERADYLVLDSGAGAGVGHIIFHEPEEKGKGLTLTPTVDGNLLIGPSERPWDGADGFATAAAGLDWLRTQAMELVPDLDLGQTIRSFGALRPNPFYVRRVGEAWVPEDKSISNFTVMEPAPGFWSFIGIKTPGLTCAEGLGRYAAELVCKALDIREQRTDFDPVRRRPVRVKELSAAEWSALVEKCPEYGNVVCRCGRITEGEIVEAIRRGAVTVNGVKRRAGSGLGRCQGGFCEGKILAILAREQNLPASAIRADGPDSWVVCERENWR